MRPAGVTQYLVATQSLQWRGSRNVHEASALNVFQTGALNSQPNCHGKAGTRPTPAFVDGDRESGGERGRGGGGLNRF